MALNNNSNSELDPFSGYKYTDLDYDEMYESVTEYFRDDPTSPFATINGFDFEGSNIRELFRELVYVSHLNTFNTSVALNEMYSSTARLRKNVMKGTRGHGYRPRRLKTSEKALSLFNSSTETKSVPAFHEFKATQNDGEEKSFYTLESWEIPANSIVQIVVYQANSGQETLSLEFTKKNGVVVPIAIEVSELTEDYFVLQTVEGGVVVNWVEYRDLDTLQQEQDVLEESRLDESKIFFLDETATGYTISFSETGIGSIPNPDGDDIITLKYLTSDAVLSDGIETSGFELVPLGSWLDSSNNSVISIVPNSEISGDLSQDSVGFSSKGKLKESAVELKENNIAHYNNQNRAVTDIDYTSLAKTSSLIGTNGDVKAYGGEKHTAALRLGKVFLLGKPSVTQKYYFTPSEKVELLEFITKYKNSGITPIIQNPQYINVLVKYNYIFKQFVGDQDEITTELNQTILDFFQSNFGETIYIPELSEALNVNEEIESAFIKTDYEVVFDRLLQSEGTLKQIPLLAGETEELVNEDGTFYLGKLFGGPGNTGSGLEPIPGNEAQVEFVNQSEDYIVVKQVAGTIDNTTFNSFEKGDVYDTTRKDIIKINFQQIPAQRSVYISSTKGFTSSAGSKLTSYNADYTSGEIQTLEVQDQGFKHQWLTVDSVTYGNPIASTIEKGDLLRNEIGIVGTVVEVDNSGTKRIFVRFQDPTLVFEDGEVLKWVTNSNTLWAYSDTSAIKEIGTIGTFPDGAGEVCYKISSVAVEGGVGGNEDFVYSPITERWTNDTGFSLVNEAGTPVLFSYSIDNQAVTGIPIVVYSGTAVSPNNKAVSTIPQIMEATRAVINANASFSAVLDATGEIVTVTQAGDGTDGNQANPTPTVTDSEFTLSDFQGGATSINATCQVRQRHVRAEPTDVWGFNQIDQTYGVGDFVRGIDSTIETVLEWTDAGGDENDLEVGDFIVLVDDVSTPTYTILGTITEGNISNTVSIKYNHDLASETYPPGDGGLARPEQFTAGRVSADWFMSRDDGTGVFDGANYFNITNIRNNDFQNSIWLKNAPSGISEGDDISAFNDGTGTNGLSGQVLTSRVFDIVGQRLYLETDVATESSTGTNVEHWRDDGIFEVHKGINITNILYSNIIYQDGVYSDTEIEGLTLSDVENLNVGNWLKSATGLAQIINPSGIPTASTVLLENISGSFESGINNLHVVSDQDGVYNPVLNLDISRNISLFGTDYVIEPSGVGKSPIFVNKLDFDDTGNLDADPEKEEEVDLGYPLVFSTTQDVDPDNIIFEAEYMDNSGNITEVPLTSPQNFKVEQEILLDYIPQRVDDDDSGFIEPGDYVVQNQNILSTTSGVSFTGLVTKVTKANESDPNSNVNKILVRFDKGTFKKDGVSPFDGDQSTIKYLPEGGTAWSDASSDDLMVSLDLQPENIQNDDGFTLLNNAGTSKEYRFAKNGGTTTGGVADIPINSAMSASDVAQAVAQVIEVTDGSFTASAVNGTVTVTQLSVGTNGNQTNPATTVPNNSSFAVSDFTGGTAGVEATCTITTPRPNTPQTNILNDQFIQLRDESAVDFKYRFSLNNGTITPSDGSQIDITIGMTADQVGEAVAKSIEDSGYFNAVNSAGVVTVTQIGAPADNTSQDSDVSSYLTQFGFSPTFLITGFSGGTATITCVDVQEQKDFTVGDAITAKNGAEGTVVYSDQTQTVKVSFASTGTEFSNTYNFEAFYIGASPFVAPGDFSISNVGTNLAIGGAVKSILSSSTPELLDFENEIFEKQRIFLDNVVDENADSTAFLKIGDSITTETSGVTGTVIEFAEDNSREVLILFPQGSVINIDEGIVKGTTYSQPAEATIISVGLVKKDVSGKVNLKTGDVRIRRAKQISDTFTSLITDIPNNSSFEVSTGDGSKFIDPTLFDTQVTITLTDSVPSTWQIGEFVTAENNATGKIIGTSLDNTVTIYYLSSDPPFSSLGGANKINEGLTYVPSGEAVISIVGSTVPTVNFETIYIWNGENYQWDKWNYSGITGDLLSSSEALPPKISTQMTVYQDTNNVLNRNTFKFRNKIDRLHLGNRSLFYSNLDLIEELK